MKQWLLIFFVAFPYALNAQVDTTEVYKDRSDTLATAVATGSGNGNFLSRSKELRTEVISAAGLCKMACCSLAESFENSSSVTVGYSDAVTGARQIKLLGLSGTYTQMLDENRPVMRGLASPFGLSYVPGQWLNSIQIAKGAPSVINGVESITGQINMEHRKPTDEIPLFVNASVMSDAKADLNIASSLQLDKEGKWSTVILGHVCGNFAGFDMNDDGLLDDPRQLGINLSNRWLYYGEDGTQVRFGFRFLKDGRTGGEYDPAAGNGKKPAYNYETYLNPDSRISTPFWGSDISNQSISAYLKVGVPLNDDNSSNIALVSDFTDYMSNSGFGRTRYDADQMSGFINLLYQNQMYDAHHFTLGLSTTYDRFTEMLDRHSPVQRWKMDNAVTHLADVGVFGEYTFHLDERFSLIAGARADWYNGEGLKFSPRLTVKYAPIDQLVIRFNGGRGLRRATPLSDNIGVLSTSKYLMSEHSRTSSDAVPLFASHPLEDAWVFGGNVTYYFPELGAGKDAFFSFDYFRTQFSRQLVVDYDAAFQRGECIDFYMLNGDSFTDTFQADFSVEPIKRFTVSATFRYTNAKIDLYGRGMQDRPMTSKFKGVLNLQYATNLNKWIFDLTASINGPCRLYDFMGGGNSPVFPLLYAQVTHRMKGWDIYFGGENLTNFTQKDVVLGTPMADSSRALKTNPELADFDASCIWGPLMGIKAYVGVRITLWKKG